ncbi:MULTISPECIES: hypothetical protein [unclassified Methylobacterium]|uniref:hypothetical protein n=1 Tax=unclassified Methylobacterium TaxID=2615210 RepID=UPI0011C1FE6F|nr:MULTISPECIES: hypothetical protein [unclassified Methylobacterium]QEE38968.1 hypothetical protein FVA80_08400 [Methylobacterium sp. WL1]TXN53973.1 hypothetical protein FV241_25965 [Methylobacterium sp. WL2]
MDGDNPQNDDMTALVRIARTLRVPVATFLTACPVGTSNTDSAVVAQDHPAEVVALLRLFVRLKSPEARARCLAYVVQEVTNDG